MPLVDILVLYLIFRGKQLICDFILQTAWMANVKGHPFNMGGAKALGMHAGIHAAFTFAIMLMLAPAFWWLGIIDFLVHGLIDKAKIMIIHKFKWTYQDNAYWWAFGIDQEAHNITHLIYIVIVVMNTAPV